VGRGREDEREDEKEMRFPNRSYDLKKNCPENLKTNIFKKMAKKHGIFWGGFSIFVSLQGVLSVYF
jgi:hypothetical protein